ncbi:hypothetical protein M2322_004737, partial [Rhodoblastus acidophilus]|uniref:hypothetical protein n=1 Tax=Rhodoblastus acidophilus TaxID=1074 RepID=UPI002225ABAB
SKKDIEQVAGAWRDYSRAAGLAANSASWTKAQASQVKAWENQTVAALRRVKSEQAAFNRSVAKVPPMPTLPSAAVGRHGGSVGSWR